MAYLYVTIEKFVLINVAAIPLKLCPWWQHQQQAAKELVSTTMSIAAT